MANKNEKTRKTNLTELSGYVVRKTKNEKGQGTFITLSVFAGRNKETNAPLPRTFIDVGFFGSKERQVKNLEEDDFVNVKGVLTTVKRKVPGQEKEWSFLSVVGRSAVVSNRDKTLDPKPQNSQQETQNAQQENANEVQNTESQKKQNTTQVVR